MSIVFPFSAILGQDRMKNAVIWNTINPKIGGALLSGQKGTAKSTLVRALAQLLQNQKVVELPLNITEDRLVGSIDIQAAIQTGRCSFEPGILEKAHGNMLYMDEVNLLSDHIVNALLEAAASGINQVEREGISYTHPSEFVMIGSMNPEEGKLRPQFLDRFGLYVEVEGCDEVVKRMEITRRRLEYEQDTVRYYEQWREEEDALRDKIEKAKQNLRDVCVTENAARLAATLSNQANCAGQRAELCIIETARAIAALEGRTTLNVTDIRTAAEYALPHRARDVQPPSFRDEQPEENTWDSQGDQNEEKNEQSDPDRETDGEPGENERTDEQSCRNEEMDERSDPSEKADNRPGPGEESKSDLQMGEDKDSQSKDGDSDREKSDSSDVNRNAEEKVEDIGDLFQVCPWIHEYSSKTVRMGSGRRSVVKTSANQGRYIRAVFPHRNEVSDIAFDATLRAAAPYQRFRGKNGMALAIHSGDIRTRIREKRTGNTILFVVDASGSMGANQRMKAVKGAVCSLLNDAYQKRDKVGMIAFRKESAELILGITCSVDLAQKKMAVLPTGGRTPLGAGLMLAWDVLHGAAVRDRDILPVVVLISDGRANAPKGEKRPIEEAKRWARKLGESGAKCIVIDTEKDFIRLGLARQVAEEMHADYFRVEELNAERLVGVVSGFASSGRG